MSGTGETKGKTVDEAARVLGDLARRDESLRPYSGYGVGGRTALLSKCNSMADVELVVEAVRETGIPVVVVGFGSNTLVSDAGWPGLALVLGKGFHGMQVNPATGVVTTGSRVGAKRVVYQTARAALAGLEWAIGVPGSMGGLVAMNAGCYGGQMADVVTRVEVVDLLSGATEEWSNSRCGFRFRGSAVGSNHLVTRMWLQLAPGEQSISETRIEEIRAERARTQPEGPNTGSVFAVAGGWRTIEEAGASDVAIGTALVSPKHANFIEVRKRPPARAADVLAVMVEVRRRVLEATGSALPVETRFLGFSEEELAPLELATHSQ